MHHKLSAIAPALAVSAVLLVTPAPSVAAMHTPPAARPATSFSQRPAYQAPLLYVGNRGNNSITVYSQNANGNAAPIRTIAGPNTQLNFTGIGQLSQDAAGNLWVAQNTGSILIFAHGATGNVAPIGILGGPLTGLLYASTVTVDKVTGKIFVFNFGNYNEENLVRFPPGAVGNEAPFATTGPDYDFALQLTQDSTGNNIIEGNEGCCESLTTRGVLTLPKQFANNTSPHILYQINSFADNGVVDHPTTGTYLTSRANQIDRFQEDTNGSGSDAEGNPPAKFLPPPVSIINNVSCPTQLALGSQREIFTTHSYSLPYCPAPDAVYVYRHDAHGNASPMRLISGTATLLNQPAYIYAGI